jgi:hypothetical protein
MLIEIAFLLAMARHDGDARCQAAFDQVLRQNVLTSGFSSHVGFVEARIGEEGEPIWLLLDTGANRSALDAGFAARSGLPVLDGTRVEGSAGIVEAGSTRVSGLRLGSVVLPTLDPTTSNLAGLQGPNGQLVVGILGSDALEGLIVAMDFATGTISVSPPSLETEAAGRCGRAIPTEDDNGILRLQAKIDGHAVPLRYDSGAGIFADENVWINLTRAQHATVRSGMPDNPPFRTLGGSGTGGQLSLPVHLGHRLEIGDLVWEEPRLIVQPQQGYFARPDAVGFVGNALFWSQRRMIIDYPGHRLILPPES